jgi:Holliday junction resolvase
LAKKLKLKPKAINETDIKRQVKTWLTYMGYFNFHVLQGMGAFKGIPDRIAVKNGVVYFIEVKTPKGIQSEYQIEFQKNIEKAGGRYMLVRSLEELIKGLKKAEEEEGVIDLVVDEEKTVLKKYKLTEKKGDKLDVSR